MLPWGKHWTKWGLQKILLLVSQYGYQSSLQEITALLTPYKVVGSWNTNLKWQRMKHLFGLRSSTQKSICRVYLNSYLQNSQECVKRLLLSHSFPCSRGCCIVCGGGRVTSGRCFRIMIFPYVTDTGTLCACCTVMCISRVITGFSAVAMLSVPCWIFFGISFLCWEHSIATS